MPVPYRRKLVVPEFCCVCGQSLEGQWFRRGPPRTVCERRPCIQARDNATRARRAAQEAHP